MHDTYAAYKNKLLYKRKRMDIFRSNHIIITFGTKKESFIPAEISSNCSPTQLLNLEPFSFFANALACKRLWLLHQVHGVQGHQVPLPNYLGPFLHDGDFLITQNAQEALGTVTADCLPLILYDPNNHGLATIHAGWRGAVQGVALKCIERMEHTFNTNPADLQAFIGPSAKSCCYKVDSTVIEHLTPPFYSAATQLNSTHHVLDLPLLISLQLQSKGVFSINTHFNQCTICSKQYCSFRRDKNLYRQLTAAVLI